MAFLLTSRILKSTENNYYLATQHPVQVQGYINEEITFQAMYEQETIPFDYISINDKGKDCF